MVNWEGKQFITLRSTRRRRAHGILSCLRLRINMDAAVEAVSDPLTVVSTGYVAHQPRESHRESMLAKLFTQKSMKQFYFQKQTECKGD